MTATAPLHRRSPVNIFAMSHAQNQNCLAIIVNPADHAIVTDPISAETRSIAGKDFSELAGVTLAGNARLKEGDDALLRIAVEFLEVAQGARFEVNGPGQVVSPLPPAGWEADYLPAWKWR